LYKIMMNQAIKPIAPVLAPKYYSQAYCKRYNTKTFESYQAAKKYVRRLVTRLHGSYSDTYSQYGFTIQKV